MKQAAMRFGGYSFRHNPAKLRIEDTANTAPLISPCTPPDSVHLGRGLRCVRGEGELYGADCVAQYRALYELYERGERALLSIPQLPPMPAYLKELRLNAEPLEDVLGFSFVFLEAWGQTAAVTPQQSYTVQSNGESLWDIAYAHDTRMDELVRLNPQIADISDLPAGERVRLC